VATTSKPIRAVFDACCFLVFIANQEDAAATARRVLTLIDDELVELVESACILTEVPPTHRDDDGSGKRARILAMLGSEAVDLRPATRAIAERAGDYVVSRGLRPMDAIHLATAVEAEVVAFVTLDKDDFPIGEVVDGVRIMLPEQFLQDYFPPNDQPEFTYSEA